MKPERIDHSKLVDLVNGKLSPQESLELLGRIEREPAASEELDVIVDLVNVVRGSGNELFAERREEQAPVFAGLRKLAADLLALLKERRVVYAVASIAVVVLGLFIASALSTDKFLKLAYSSKLEFEIPVRGPDVAEFTLAQQFFTDGHFDESIRTMERYLRAFPQSPRLDFAHYAAGATYLASARHTVLTFFPSADLQKVQLGMQHLEAAVELSGNPRLVEDARWLRGAGFLLMDKPAEAIMELRAVVQMNGPKKDAAFQLIEKIQDLQKGG